MTTFDMNRPTPSTYADHLYALEELAADADTAGPADFDFLRARAERHFNALKSLACPPNLRAKASMIKQNAHRVFYGGEA